MQRDIIQARLSKARTAHNQSVLLHSLQWHNLKERSQDFADARHDTMSEIEIKSIFSRIIPPPRNSKSHQGLLAGGSCRGICSRYSITTKWGQKKYELGLRFCSYCRVWFDHDRLCCICCGKRLRYKRRDNPK